MTRSASSVLCAVAILVAAWMPPSTASAVPKLDIKVFLGVGTTRLVPRIPSFQLDSGTEVGGRNPANFFNWQGGLAARVRAGKLFGEIGLVFGRFNFTVSETLAEIAIEEGNPLDPAIIGARAKMNSLDLPITAGYIPYQNPYFKLFLYGGLVNKFNIRGFVETGGRGRGIQFRPKDIPGFPLVVYQAGARFGVAFDLGPVNFDFNYTIGMNSITKTDFRTNSQVFQFNLGWLF